MEGTLTIKTETRQHDIQVPLKGGKFKTYFDEIVSKAKLYIIQFAFEDFQSCSFLIERKNSKHEVEYVENMDLTEYLNTRT